MKTRRMCKAERSSLDIISALPQPILETILCLLHTKEATKTSILSREWRYKWTTIPKLEFHLSHVSNRITKENMDVPWKPFDDLLQILLLHQGPIHEFILHINTWRADNDSFGFDQIILYLSKNPTIKKLTPFGYYDDGLYNLPASFFSMRHLTDLVLSSVNLDHQPVLNGFASVRSLVLENVGISTETLLHILSNSPSLKSLTLVSSHLNNVYGLRNLAEYNKLLQLICESLLGDRDCTVFELFECLPMIEDLTTFSDVSVWLALDFVPQELPSLLFHLKYLCFEQMCFVDGYGLAFLLVLIKCSPKLEKIKLEIDWGHCCFGEYLVVWEEYSDVLLEHLNELEINNFSNSKPEMEFVKFILARSPKLKKVSLLSDVKPDQESEMLKTLLQAPRASPVVITIR